MTRVLTSPADDYRLLREGAQALDLASWCVLRVTGPDARPFLQGMATQDLAAAAGAAAAGAGAAGAALTLFLTEKGRPVALAWVVLDSGDAAWVFADEGARGVLRPHFERFRIMEDVGFEGPDGMPPLIGVAGPRRAARALALAAENPGARAVHGEPLSFVLGGVAPSGGGAPAPARSLSFAHPDAAEAWRLCVGLPRTGVDFDTDRIATELDLPQAISDTKGCYVGQEVVARTSNRGQVRRRRVGFRFPWTGAAPTPRAELLAGGASVGFLTSAAPVPGTATGLGMGYLSTESIEAGSPIGLAGTSASIEIAPWPL